MDEYTLEIYLSTDGKHTVKTISSTPEGNKKAYGVAVAMYDQILAKYGTKQAQAVKEYAKDNGTTDLGVCDKCGAPNKLSSKGKPYCSAKCWLK
jgi:hypothetical protein